ncbi:putative deoxyribonuclease [Stappia sp. 22II-S9-Z10]|nr:putative deoxyribonuclease [Stappia sp. 22II-S9-Z10]
MTCLSPQQDAAVKAVEAWRKDRSGRQWFYLAGFAGTGKTFLATRLAQGVKGSVVFAAFTGKAALVMRSKGCEGASTIHSLIYRPDEKGGVTSFRLNKDSAVADAALVVIDEVSMVGEDLARDLLSFGKKVLVLGDPAQLPPVKGEAFFTANEPDFMLTEVHRQAAENPIIRMSMEVREGRPLDVGSYGESVVIPRAKFDGEAARKADQILVGLNRTRTSYNARMRHLLGHEAEHPVNGDRLVCLRNVHAKTLFNGSIWEVAKRKKPTVDGFPLLIRSLDIGGDDMPLVEVRAHRLAFIGRSREIPFKQRREFEEFDYGYALTVHKSQGSQWDDVCLFDESGAFREDRHRHLYTGLTRAAERVTVVIR